MKVYRKREIQEHVQTYLYSFLETTVHFSEFSVKFPQLIESLHHFVHALQATQSIAPRTVRPQLDDHGLAVGAEQRPAVAVEEHAAGADGAASPAVRRVVQPKLEKCRAFFVRSSAKFTEECEKIAILSRDLNKNTKISSTEVC